MFRLRQRPFRDHSAHLRVGGMQKWWCGTHSSRKERRRTARSPASLRANMPSLLREPATTSERGHDVECGTRLSSASYENRRYLASHLRVVGGCKGTTPDSIDDMQNRRENRTTDTTSRRHGLYAAAPLRCRPSSERGAPAGSFDDRHQLFREFAPHHVFIHQPQDSLWHLGVR